MNVKDIEKPNYKKDLSNTQILTRSISPIKLLQIIDDNEFEEIIHEWAYGFLIKKYEKVCRLGGPGDKGRDITGYYDYKNNVWDNFQCKHYDHKLRPSDIWVEIGKLCYNCFTEELKPPKKYFFVSPRGVGTQVHDLLKNSNKLKLGLKNNWNKYCENGIFKSQKLELSGELLDYLDNFDYNIFDYLDPMDLIDQLKQTPYFTSRFGNITKPRPIPKKAPEDIQEIESIYIKKILDAYSDYLNKSIENAKKLSKYPDLVKDFERHRKCFFCAESLKEFSRDIFDPDLKCFEELEEEIFDGIIDTIEEDADNGFQRLKKVLIRATEIQITNNQLISEVRVNDRKGICHHLANEREEVKWRK